MGREPLVYARNFANQSLVTMVCGENAGVFCVFSSVADVTKRAAKSSIEVDAGSGAGEPGQQRHVVGDDRRPDIGLEVREPAPGAATQAEGSLQARDVGFDAGAEVAQLAIDPVALDHVFDREPARLVECHILYAHGLGLREVVGAGIATVTAAWRGVAPY